MKPPFRLVPDTISKDVVQALTELLEQAQQGQIYGMAFVAMVKGRYFIANTAGECERNLDYTRSLLLRFDDKLADRLRQQTPLVSS
jgi:hypothetical protein